MRKGGFIRKSKIVKARGLLIKPTKIKVKVGQKLTVLPKPRFLRLLEALPGFADNTYKQ